MSENRHDDLLERAKAITELVDKILFPLFSLEERGYRVDGKDSKKPLGFGLIDSRLFKLELYQDMKHHGHLQMLLPPFPGLWRLVTVERQQHIKAIVRGLECRA